MERAGWVVMGLIVAAAGVGAFGGGGVAAARVTAGDGLSIEYPRFCRSHSPLDVTIEWLPAGEPVLWLARSYLDDFAIEEIRPQPVAVAANVDRIHYWFRTPEPDTRLVVTFQLKPKRGGVARGRLGPEHAAGVEFRQLIFP